jgi:hypothetical protein
MASCNTLGRLPIFADPEYSHRFRRAVGPIQRYEWRLQAVRVQDEATVRRPTNDGDGGDRQQPVESAASWTSGTPSFHIASSLSPLCAWLVSR